MLTKADHRIFPTIVQGDFFHFGVPLRMIRLRHNAKFAPHAMRGDNFANHDMLFHRLIL